MKEELFSGVCTALITPFLDEKVNYPLVEQLLYRQINAGVSAVVISGTTGESPTLSDTEKITLFKHAKACVGNQCKIIAGTGSNNTAHAITLSQAAEAAGADALLVVAPYYNKGNSNGLFSHYMSIAQAVKIPVIIYNVPSRTGIDLPVSIYQKLSVIPNIIGVKEASSDITKISKIKNACGPNFFIWSGNDDQIVPTISLGGRGIISVLSNIYPEETIAMTNAALSGDFNTAMMLQLQLMPLIEALFKEVNPIPVKYAMKYMGFDCGNCRLPLGKIGQEAKEMIDRYFA